MWRLRWRALAIVGADRRDLSVVRPDILLTPSLNGLLAEIVLPLASDV